MERGWSDTPRWDSESRRANALLRTSKITAELHTIYRPDGVVSPLYPKTLQDLTK